MKNYIALGLILLSSLVSFGQTNAPVKKLNVVTTLPVLRDIAAQVGGEWVLVQSLAEPNQDAHFVQPKPTLIKKAAVADVFIEVGMSLELWGQKIIDAAGNTKIQTGQPGRVITSNGVDMMEIPLVLSREFGDVHPNGNPHIWLDPINVKKMAVNIYDGFVRVDPTHQEAYQKNLEAYQKKIDEALFGSELLKIVGSKKLTRLCEQGNLIKYLEEKKLISKLGGWLKKSENLRGKKVVTYHRTWAYFANRFGFKVLAEIEDKPGIPPSIRHRDEVVALMNQNNVRTILMEIFYDRVPAEYIAKKAAGKIVQVPIDVGALPQAGTYIDFIGYILAQLSKT